MELRQEQKLKQTLSQNMLQSTEILQMGQLELKEYLEDLALENPVVDMDEMRSEKSSDDKGESNEDFIRSWKSCRAWTLKTASIIRTSRMRPAVSNRQKDLGWI